MRKGEREPGCHWWETKKEKGRTVQTQSVPSSYHLHTVVGTAENGWDLLLKTHTLLPTHFSKSKLWILVFKAPYKNVQGGHLFMTLLSMINFKLSQQRFWHYHVNTLAKMILKKSLSLNLSFKLNSLCKALQWIPQKGLGSIFLLSPRVSFQLTLSFHITKLHWNNSFMWNDTLCVSRNMDPYSRFILIQGPWLETHTSNEQIRWNDLDYLVLIVRPKPLLTKFDK